MAISNYSPSTDSTESTDSYAYYSYHFTWSIRHSSFPSWPHHLFWMNSIVGFSFGPCSFLLEQVKHLSHQYRIWWCHSLLFLVNLKQLYLNWIINFYRLIYILCCYCFQPKQFVHSSNWVLIWVISCVGTYPYQLSSHGWCFLKTCLLDFDTSSSPFHTGYCYVHYS